MSVTSGSFRPGRANVVLFVSALISRTAGYAIRMSGAVGGALSDGRPYPYVCRARHTFLRVSLYFSIMEVKASPKPSQMEAKGIVLSQRGIR